MSKAYKVSFRLSYVSIFTAKCEKKQYLRVHWQKIAQTRLRCLRVFPTLFQVYCFFV